MSNAAPLPSGAPGPCHLELSDSRADAGRREVELARERIVIRRSVADVAMTITLPAQTFEGVSLRLREREGVFAFEIALVHRDGDFTVPLARLAESPAAEALWRDWTGFFGLPALIERRLGADEPEVSARPLPAPRRRGRWMTSRRPRFLTRRQVGDPSRMTPLAPAPQLFPAI
jgi:hypothetical protein